MESTLRHRVGLDLGREHVHDPMEVCHARSNPNVEANPRIGMNIRERGYAHQIYTIEKCIAR